MKQPIKAALLGCLEIPLFMKISRDRFVNSPEAMKQSFLVPLLILPLGILIAPVNPEFAALPFPKLAFRFALDFCLVVFVYLLFMRAVAKALDRSQYFFQFVTAYNWLNLTSLVISLPFFVLAMKGIYEWDEVKNILIGLVLYGYAYLAFAITMILRINWMLAASLAIVSMALGQVSNALVY